MRFVGIRAGNIDRIDDSRNEICYSLSIRCVLQKKRQTFLNSFCLKCTSSMITAIVLYQRKIKISVSNRKWGILCLSAE